MNLIINLPPKEDREDLINAWVEGLIKNDYSRYYSKVNETLEEGFNTHSVNCLFIHESTARLVRSRVEERQDSPWISVAFSSPICLN